MALTALLLDSDVVIDHLNGVAAAGVFLDSNRLACVVSPVTRAEVLAGADGGVKLVATELLDLFPCLKIDATVGDRAGELRCSHGLKIADAFQLAMAELHGCQLVTRNIKDFKPSRHPQVLVPYSL